MLRRQAPDLHKRWKPVRVVVWVDLLRRAGRTALSRRSARRCHSLLHQLRCRPWPRRCCLWLAGMRCPALVAAVIGLAVRGRPSGIDLVLRINMTAIGMLGQPWRLHWRGWQAVGVPGRGVDAHPWLLAVQPLGGVGRLWIVGRPTHTLHRLRRVHTPTAPSRMEAGRLGVSLPSSPLDIHCKRL